ncbi:hypothetical protein [Nonomuraea terrae]|uniref:hypothetical protein n=1 Tax=Nonomuraea terrae TaxID=2530383 RepID=UPI0016527C28|nr:hypothetical protein [Nonomuraea terrae]
MIRRRAAEQAEDWPTTLVARFVTLGGAMVDLDRQRFTTTFDHRGAPYGASKPYEIDGYNWRCHGCGSYGREGDTYHDPGFRREQEAREDANDHAGMCRAVPRPIAAAIRGRIADVQIRHEQTSQEVAR